MTETDLPKLKPTLDRLIIWLNPGAQETPSGLIIPPMAQQITQHGKVLAVGPDVKDVSVGDTVLIDLHCGTHLCWKKNTPVLMVDLKNIQAVLTDLE